MPMDTAMLRTPGANSLTPGRFAGASYSGSTHPGKRPGNVTFQFPDSSGRSFRQGMGTNASLSTWGSDFSPTMHTTNGISPQSPLQVSGFHYHFCRWQHSQNQRSYSQKIILRQYHLIERLATVNGSDRSQTRRWFHRRFGWWPCLFCHTHCQGMSMRTDVYKVLKPSWFLAATRCPCQPCEKQQSQSHDTQQRSQVITLEEAVARGGWVSKAIQ